MKSNDPMPRPGDLSRHFWLTQGMARTLGIRFSDALHAGRLTPENFAALITTCRGCTMSDHCMGWMARAQAQREPVPDFCENAERLRRLSPHRPK